MMSNVIKWSVFQNPVTFMLAHDHFITQLFHGGFFHLELPRFPILIYLLSIAGGFCHLELPGAVAM